jgi:hypothetical protein
MWSRGPMAKFGPRSEAKVAQAGQAEPVAAPDGGRITVFWSSLSHQRPPRVSVVVRLPASWLFPT